MDKKKYKVLRPVAIGERKEAGDIVELTDEEAQAFSQEDLQAMPEEEKVGEEKDNEESENQESNDSDESDSSEQ